MRFGTNDFKFRQLREITKLFMQRKYIKKKSAKLSTNFDDVPFPFSCISKQIYLPKIINAHLITCVICEYRWSYRSFNEPVELVHKTSLNDSFWNEFN